ncbi:MAG TPA: PadR family transcriptional regulator [Anaerolineae bacterium]|nr:PadR family transcriptional regulator [Anaerolineae bacterium]
MQGRGHGRRWRQSGYSRRAVRFLEPTLLLLLHRGPSHGYTFLSELDGFGLGEMDPSAVYRLLRDMEGQGWVESDWDEERTQGPPRRVYRLTAQGNEVLGWWMADLRETAEIIDRLLDSHKRHMKEGAGDYH